MKISVRKSF